jgi:hypothetical protein
MKIKVLWILHLVGKNMAEHAFKSRDLPIHVHHVELQKLGDIDGNGWGIRH